MAGADMSGRLPGRLGNGGHGNGRSLADTPIRTIQNAGAEEATN